MNTDNIYAESIAKDYAPRSTSKITALKKLDRKAKRPAEVFAYIFGTVFTLVFGTGLCFAMKVIGSGTTVTMVAGIIVGVIGMVGIGVNNPRYKQLPENGKKKYTFEIMESAKEIAAE